MKKVLIIMFLMSGYFVHAQEVYFVAPPDHAETPGNDTLGVGSYAAPWATFQKAFNEAQAGDTVYFRGGVYWSTSTNNIDLDAYPEPIGNTGTAENPICYFGYPGEWPILDCSKHCDTPGTSYNSAIYIGHAEYIHFKDFEVRNVLQCDSTLTGAIASSYAANLTFEHLIVHNVAERGFYINGGAWGEHTQDPVPLWDSDSTYFINCDVYDLCDTLGTSAFPNPGNGADAWKVVFYGGNFVLFDGCRAWNYSDDAIDPSNANGAQYVFNNCWVMASNKYAEYEIEGTGWKMSSVYELSLEPTDIVHASLTNCIAAFCPGAGLGNNIFLTDGKHIPNNGIFYNNTFYNCGYGIHEFTSVDGISTSIYKNNISYASIEEASGLRQPLNFYNTATYIIESHNTFDWDYGYPGFIETDAVKLNDNDFVTLDSLDIVAEFTAKRQSDGSLPAIRPLRLFQSPDSLSDLIDAGTDIGLSYNGSNPDIGATEANILSDNTYPTVVITSPSKGNTFENSTGIPITAYASDSDGWLGKVEFFYKDRDTTVLLGEGIETDSDLKLWSFVWNNAPTGLHALRVVATDNQEAKATSASVSVLVLPGEGDEDQNIGFLSENRNRGVFTFTLIDPLLSGDIVIVSIEGRVIYKETMNEPEKLISLSNISPGMYILFLSSNGKILSTHKFVKY